MEGLRCDGLEKPEMDLDRVVDQDVDAEWSEGGICVRDDLVDVVFDADVGLDNDDADVMSIGDFIGKLCREKDRVVCDVIDDNIGAFGSKVPNDCGANT